jgi:hypothetical protein
MVNSHWEIECFGTLFGEREAAQKQLHVRWSDALRSSALRATCTRKSDRASQALSMWWVAQETSSLNIAHPSDTRPAVPGTTRGRRCACMASCR